ncbi:MAG: YbhB/YbcL family Raf kinase inhibitor-like protein [Candidatus Omnitrophica bacterium]|nr:YbhB/YbcL family Raf kinase inhibitor-like protein [Candidatus Omnitrophota bacterium]
MKRIEFKTRGALPWFLVMAAVFLPQTAARGAEEVAMQLTSSAFKANQPIPRQYTCEGKDLSPALQWMDPPAGMKSFALISDDPDAPMGTWVHWVVWNLPADLRGLPEGVAKEAKLPDGTAQGITDFGRTGYGGPCPPPGKPHRYFFKLYALDTMLHLPSNIRKRELEAAMKEHILAQAELVGLYQR